MLPFCLAGRPTNASRHQHLSARPRDKEGPAHIGGLPRSRRWGIIAFPDSGRNIAVPVIDVVIGVADAPVPIWPSVGRSIKTAAIASVVIPWAQLVGAAGVGNTCAQPKTGRPKPPDTSTVVANREIRFMAGSFCEAHPLALLVRSVQTVRVDTDPNLATVALADSWSRTSWPCPCSEHLRSGRARLY